jgi:hypothetical protein
MGLGPNTLNINVFPNPVRVRVSYSNLVPELGLDFFSAFPGRQPPPAPSPLSYPVGSPPPPPRRPRSHRHSPAAPPAPSSSSSSTTCAASPPGCFASRYTDAGHPRHPCDAAQRLEEHSPAVRFDSLSCGSGGGLTAPRPLPEGCCVCLGDFHTAAEVRCARGCRHIFHRACLDR